MLGSLCIVATPIGNLEDITLRALKILKEVDLIVAEDTRQTSKLLNHYDIHVPIVSYHQHSSEQKKMDILRELLEGKNVALVTDAGTPGISDPGNELIEFLRRENEEIKIIPVPGASALTAALSVSGIPANKFVFLGFMPKKKKDKIFTWLKEGKLPFVFYESPFRLFKSLEIVKNTFGPEVNVFIARELTKVYETLYSGNVESLLKILKDKKIKGEIVVVVRI